MDELAVELNSEHNNNRNGRDMKRYYYRYLVQTDIQEQLEKTQKIIGALTTVKCY